MYRKVLIFAILMQSICLFSQHSEVGFFVGGSYYLGEINPHEHFTNTTNPAIGVFYKKNINRRYALNLNLNYGKLAASDQNVADEFNTFRNLSFSSNLLDASLLLEFNFLPYSINDRLTKPYSPYVFGGVSVFNTKAEVTNNYTNTSYKSGGLIAPAFTFGAGIKFDLVRNFGANIFWGFRKTFTDEIDGINNTLPFGYQLGNSKNYDWYSIAGISINYKILTKKDRCARVIN